MVNGNVLRHIRRIIGAAETGDLTDRQLLEHFVQGEDAAFTALVQRHAPLVWGVCQRVLHHAHDAEDAFQATFLVLARKAASIVWQDSVGHWLHGVAWRIATKARARAFGRRERQVQEMPAVEAPEDKHWQDLRPVLDEEVNRLPAKYRAAVVLCYLQGKTNEQAALELGCPKGTILSRLARGRERLRTRLGQRGVALSAAAVVTILSHQAAPAAAPAAVVDATAKAAILFATGQAASAGAISAQADLLAEGVLKAMFMTKVSIAATLLLALTLVGTGTAVFLHQNTPATNGNDQGTARKDPTNLFGEVLAYEKDKSIALNSGQGKFEFAIENDKTVVRVIGDAKNLAVGMQATVWADNEDPKKATRIVANTMSPKAQGEVLAYEESKSITLEVTNTQPGGTAKVKLEFALGKGDTEIRLLQGAQALSVGMQASIWVDKDNPKQAALIEAKPK